MIASRIQIACVLCIWIVATACATPVPQEGLTLEQLLEAGDEESIVEYVDELEESTEADAASTELEESVTDVGLDTSTHSRQKRQARRCRVIAIIRRGKRVIVVRRCR